MAKVKKTYNSQEFRGMSIYQEERRTVYSPFFSKHGYIITKNNSKSYSQYVQGYLISLFIFASIYIIFKNFWIALGLGIAFFIGTLISFYLNFIKKATLIADYKKPIRDNFFVRQAKSLPKSNIITIIIACFLLSFMIIFNGYLNNFTGSYFILNTALAIVSLIYGFINIYILIYKIKNHIKEEE